MTERKFRRIKLSEAIREEGGTVTLYRLMSGFAVINDEQNRSWIYRYSKIHGYWYADCYFDTYKEAVDHIVKYIEIKKAPEFDVYDVLNEIYATKEQEYEGNEGL